MSARTKFEIVIAAIVVAILCLLFVQNKTINRLRGERDKYKNNTETLLTDVETYKVRDSLSAARVQALELTVKEFERFRADDAALVAELNSKNRDLAAINKSQSETIIRLSSIPRDTIIIRDSVKIPAVSVHCGDAWFDFDGILTEHDFSGTLHNRDSLLLAESVKYKRFLWWKTKKVKDRRMDCVSLNPHTKIIGIEHVVIEK